MHFTAAFLYDTTTPYLVIATQCNIYSDAKFIAEIHHKNNKQYANSTYDLQIMCVHMRTRLCTELQTHLSFGVVTMMTQSKAGLSAMPWRTGGLLTSGGGKGSRL